MKKFPRFLMILIALLGLTSSLAAEAKAFDSLYSDKVLGCTVQGGQTTFRLFVPRGEKAEVLIFNQPDDPISKARVVPLINDGQQVFEVTVPEVLYGKAYGYRITARRGVPKAFSPKLPLDTIFADPYSVAIAKNNVFPQKARSLILSTSTYNWEGDRPTGQKLANTVILEAHIRDLTADPTAGTKTPGFKGVIDAKRGGLAYIKSLGVNAVEFLPLMAFDNIESPYQTKTPYGQTNTWNPYARNYWGYMTTAFFAPEPYYGSDGTLDPAVWQGKDGRAVTEMKDMVKALHKAGIAVVMDVVYPHVSQFDESPLKLIDSEYFFKEQDKTGTGNEVQSRRKMVRKLITDSLTYWLKEYHIDGFRFDQGASFDRESAKLFLDTVKAINPNAFVIAEPMGGEEITGYRDFDRLGWSKWSFGINHLVRTRNRPFAEDSVFPLGNNAVAPEITEYWSGGYNDTRTDQHVAYLESHDDATLGDALRIMSGTYTFLKNGQPNRITDLDAYFKLTPNLLLAHKIAAVSLFMANGPVMIHLGQEWARGKVMPDLTGQVSEAQPTGRLGEDSNAFLYRLPTPNSYNADNATNWINFDKVGLNQNLVDFYRGLIALRQSHPALGTSDPAQVQLFFNDNPNGAGVSPDGKLFAFVNADRDNALDFTLPEGTYSVLADNDRAGTIEPRQIKGGTLTLPAGILILEKK